MLRVYGMSMDAPFEPRAEPSVDPFTEAGFRARARGGLLAAPSQAIFDPCTGRALGPGDWDLNPEFKDDLAVMAPPRPAAVLVPIVLRDPLTVTDAFSRYILCCIITTPDHRGCRCHFERLFREFGLPRVMRSDNGAPFASVGVAGLSRLSVWWLKLGITPERIAPAKPQQNGRHERMH